MLHRDLFDRSFFFLSCVSMQFSARSPPLIFWTVKTHSEAFTRHFNLLWGFTASLDLWLVERQFDIDNDDAEASH